MVDDAQHELRVEAGARRLVMDGREKFAATRVVGEARREHAGHLDEPRAYGRSLGVIAGHGVVADRALQARHDGRREVLFGLRAGMRRPRADEARRETHESRGDRALS